MNKKTVFYLFGSTLLFAIVFAIALMVGQFQISISDFFKIVFTNDQSVNIQRSIIINLRLPRTIMAACTGVALSVSGLLFQDVFQNKLTSPDLLGVSTGASVGAAIAILLGLSSAFISMFAFVFGIVTVLLTVFIAKIFKGGNTITLILAGIIVGGLMSSILSFIKFLSDPTTTLTVITYWLMGSFENATMSQVWIILPVVVITSFVLILLAWRINIVALGKEEAQTRGINYKAYSALLIGFATLLTALTVAFNGVVSWVGLVIPHLVRVIVGRDARRSIPLSIVFGGTFMIVADIISRTFTLQEIPLSAVTGLIGTIVFVVIVVIKGGINNVNKR